MTDLEEIVTLLARFAAAFDEHDAAVFRECAADNFSSSISISGGEPHVLGTLEEALQFTAAFWRDHPEQRRHVVSNVWIETHDGDSATVRSYLTLLVTERGTTRVLTSGTYRDQLVRVGGRWCVRRRHLALDAPF